jgi:hypothetical protein
MDALELLVDHRAEVDELFRVAGRRPGLHRALIAAVDAHLTVKEQILYVALPPHALHVLTVARRTALKAEAVLHELVRLDPAGPRFVAEIAGLAARFARIAEAEEEVVFPSVCAHLDDAALAFLGEVIADRLRALDATERVRTARPGAAA